MNLDDPKLTAYALGEITDPAELNELETWLAASAEGRAYVDDTREMAALLGRALHAEDAPGLTEAQRAALLSGTYATQRTNMTNMEAPKSRDSLNSCKSQKSRRAWSIVALTALAACLAAVPLLPWTQLLRLRDSSAPKVAFNEKPMTINMPQEEGKNLNSPESLAAPKAALSLATVNGRPVLRRNSNIGDELKQAREGFAKAEAAAKPLDLALPVDAPNGLQRFAVAIPSPAASPTVHHESLSVDSMAEVAIGTVAATSAPLINATGNSEGFGQKAAAKESLPGFDNGNDRTRSQESRDLDLARSEAPNTEAYDAIAENDFLAARENPLSTFSIDVDTASYANVRRFLNDGQLPPKGAVRIEEMLNYFTYDYAKPEGDAPFSTNLEVASCPWQPEHRLVRIGLKGREIPVSERKPANLVFLIDVSGSMDEPNKLPLLKQSLRLLVDQLGENDRVALAVYAGSSGLVLPSTANKEAIRNALDNLQPGGSTNGASGIRLAYEQAVAHFQKAGVNRVILATDGDFNVGVTNQSDLVDLIAEKAKSGVFLSVLGFGTGNIKDSTMEKLADKGNGNYAYIDSLREGKRALVEQMGGTLITIAKDVKIQVEFNPEIVSNYRLIGYENRALKKEDFADDKKDAGEIGSGHTVTALYEVALAKSADSATAESALKYSVPQSAIRNPHSPEMLTVKLRYKEPTGDISKLLEFPLTDTGKGLDAASRDFRFASAVAEFGQLLRHSAHSQRANWESIIARAADSLGEDKGGYRAEFVEMVKKARKLTHPNDS